MASIHRSLALGLIIFLLAGCAPPEPIRIGFLGNLTGRNADLGIAGRNGALLAIEQSNALGGVTGRKLELIIRDDENQAGSAEAAVTQLKAQGVVAIVGPMLSAMAVAAVPVTEKIGLPMISPTVTSTQFTGKDDLFFKVASSTREHTRLGVAELHKRGLRRIAVAVDLSNRAYTADWLRDFREGFEAIGGKVVAAEEFTSGQTQDYAALIGKLAKAKPDGLLLICNAIDTVQLLQLARKRGLNQPAAGATWSATEQLLELGGRTVDGFLVSQYFNRDDSSPGYQAFRNAYQKRFSQPPGFASVAAYDAMQAVLTALQRQTKEQSLKQALLTGGVNQGAQLQWSFNQFGDAQRRAYLSEVRDGRFVMLD